MPQKTDVTLGLLKEIRTALAPLANIADAYDNDALDEARRSWNRGREQDLATILYQGRGGEALIFLRDAVEARHMCIKVDAIVTATENFIQELLVMQEQLDKKVSDDDSNR